MTAHLCAPHPFEEFVGSRVEGRYRTRVGANLGESFRVVVPTHADDGARACPDPREVAGGRWSADMRSRAKNSADRTSRSDSREAAVPETR